jgi:hypothetical protein
MTPADARYSVELLDALSGLTDVREGLKKSNWLEIVALDGNQEGGTHKGASLLSLELAPKVLDFIDSLLCSELNRLGVDPDGRPVGQTRSGS